jgi:hypothetical protein
MSGYADMVAGYRSCTGFAKVMSLRGILTPHPQVDAPGYAPRLDPYERSQVTIPFCIVGLAPGSRTQSQSVSDFAITRLLRASWCCLVHEAGFEPTHPRV